MKAPIHNRSLRAFNMCLADINTVNCITIEPYADAEGVVKPESNQNFTISRYAGNAQSLEEMDEPSLVEHLGE